MHLDSGRLCGYGAKELMCFKLQLLAACSETFFAHILHLACFFVLILTYWLIFTVTTSSQKQSTTSCTWLSLPVAVSPFFVGFPLTDLQRSREGFWLFLKVPAVSQADQPASTQLHSLLEEIGHLKAVLQVAGRACVVFIRLSAMVCDFTFLTFMD